MVIEKNQIITLNDNENYFIVSIVTYDTDKYALIVNVNKDDDSKVVKFKSDDEIVEITNDNDLKILYNMFNKELN